MSEKVAPSVSARNTKTVLSVDELPIQSTLSGEDAHILVDHDVTKDEAAIMGLGYKQEFKRDFNLITVLGLAFSSLGLLPSVGSTLWYSIYYTGNAGITWVFLVGTAFITCVGLSMAEISSAFPTSGGLYYATASLSPKKYKAWASWTIGWSNYLTQLTGGPAVGWSTACLLEAVVSIGVPSYEITTWKTYLITIAITFTCACIASMPTKWLGYLTSTSAILNFAFLFISFVCILGANTRVEQGYPKWNSNSEAWGLENFTEWPAGVAVMMSMLAPLWFFSGFDSPYHIAEEASNAQKAIPWGIVLVVTFGGLLGFVFQLAIAYTIISVEDANYSELGQIYIAFLQQILPTKYVYALGSFATILTFFMCFSSMIACSRVLFSYSRDGCFPLSNVWKQINPYTKTPVNAVWCNWILGACLNLLMFGGVAINALFSFGAIGGFISFTAATFLRITVARHTFKPGPWNLGKFSIPCGTVACTFVIVMIPFLCFPQERGADNTLDSMNWTVLVFFGGMLIVQVFFFAHAHKFYTGPRSNLDAGTVVSGKAGNEIVEEVESLNPDIKTKPDN